MRSVKELMDLTGRVALITGGAGHIGSALGEALAELGARIVVLDSSEIMCRAVAEKIQSAYGVQAIPLIVDLTDEQALERVPEMVLGHLHRLDILVNCAAMVNLSDRKGWIGPFREQRSGPWRQALEVNLTAPFILTRGFAGALEESGHGSVINVSSIYGMVGPDLRLYEGTTLGNTAGYAASKGGMLQLTRWMATVMAPQVRVNAITPGGVWRQQPETFVKRYEERTPLRRMGDEEDFKGAVAYLASDLSAYVTGQNLIVDGGWTVW